MAENHPSLPLDDSAAKIQRGMLDCDVAGGRGFEPLYRGPEPRVLPLDDPPEGRPDYHRGAGPSTGAASSPYDDRRWERSQRRKSARSPSPMTRSKPRA